MRITYLNGMRLSRAFIAAARQVALYRDHLNQINVFPIPDSDTGSNMAATLQVVAANLAGLRERDFSVVARIAADSALDGARGNSGTILAQFLHGIAESVDAEFRVTTTRFARIARDAVDYAYRAIKAPQEGTILTVLTAWADSLMQRQTQDFQELLEASLRPTRESVAHTAVTLPALRDSGVVDAGAEGFATMLDGIVDFIACGSIRDLDEPPAPIDLADQPAEIASSGEIPFRYCTECLVLGTGMDQERLRTSLDGLGDSLVVAGSREKLKVHLHTNEPGKAFGYLASQGRVMAPKVDDMVRQYRVAHRPHARCAVVVDSTCDLPGAVIEELGIHVVPTHLLFAESVFVDKLGITPGQFFEMMRRNPEEVPSTSQPSPGEFRRVFEFLSSHYDEILYLGLSAGLSGTLQAAASAAAALRSPITVVDTRQASVALGLIARRVAEAVRDGADMREGAALAETLTARTRLFLTVASLDGLVRSGRLSKGQGWIASLVDLRPILSLNARGKLGPVGAAIGETGSLNRLFRHLERFVGGATPDLAVAHAGAPAAADYLEQRLGQFRDSNARHGQPATARSPFTVDVAPVLAAHTGLGTVGVAALLPEEDHG